MSATTPIPGPTLSVIADAAPVAPAHERPQNQAAPDPAPPPPEAGPPDPEAAPGDLRLLIEENEADGALTYVTLDSRTGKVVSRLPREAVLKLREAPDYRPGSLISTRG